MDFDLILWDCSLSVVFLLASVLTSLENMGILLVLIHSLFNTAQCRQYSFNICCMFYNIVFTFILILSEVRSSRVKMIVIIQSSVERLNILLLFSFRWHTFH